MLSSMAWLLSQSTRCNSIPSSKLDRAKIRQFFANALRADLIDRWRVRPEHLPRLIVDLVIKRTVAKRTARGMRQAVFRNRCAGSPMALAGKGGSRLH